MKRNKCKIRGNYEGKVSYGIAPEKLKVYSSAMALDSQFRASTQKVPKMYKLTDCAKISDGIESLLYDITMAQEMKDHLDRRVKCLNEAIDVLRRIEMRVRMLWNNGYITGMGFSAIMVKEDETMRQLIGWRNSTLNQLGLESNIQ